MSNIRFFLKLVLLVGTVRFAWGTDKYCTRAEDVIHYIKHSGKCQTIDLYILLPAIALSCCVCIQLIVSYFKFFKSIIIL